MLRSVPERHDPERGAGMSETAAEQQPPRIPFLDYLRIAAFLSVLVSHLYYERLSVLLGNPDTPGPLKLLLMAVLPFCFEGGVGVVLFFLISGYIVTHVVRRETPVQFAVKRFFRIYPLYIFVLICQIAVLAWFGQAPSPITAIQQMTLLGDFFGTPYSIGGAEWTLRIELLFYLFMLVLLVVLRAPGRALSWGRIVLVYAGITLLSGWLPPWTNGTIIWSPEWPATGSVTLYFPFLLVGSTLYLYERKLTSGLAAALLFLIVMGQYWTLLPRYQPNWSHDHHALLALALFALGWVFRHSIKAPRGILWISGLTYAIYLFHIWLVEAVLQFLPDLARLGWPIASRDLTVLLILFVVCILSMLLVERPAAALSGILLKRLAIPASPLESADQRAGSGRRP